MKDNLDLQVSLRREFAAPVARVFEAWSDPEFITRWWDNLEVAHLDFREGGSYRLQWKSWDGYVEGVYRSIKSNEEIVFSWTAHPSPEGCEESEVRIRFESLGPERTLLVLDHDLNRTIEEEKMHQQGWSGALKDLAAELPRLKNSVVVERYLDAPPPAVFEALTEGKQMDKWFFSRCHTDAREGGEMSIAWESVDAPERNHGRHGRYLKLVPAERIEFEWGGLDLDGEAEPSTRVGLTLHAEGTGTRLRLEHLGWGDSDAWTEARDQHEAGWNFFVANLQRVLSGGPDLRTATFGQKVYV